MCWCTPAIRCVCCGQPECVPKDTEKKPKQLTIEHPLYISIPRKTKEAKKVAINLNIYRNLHYLVNNQCKKIAKDNVENYLKNTGQSGIIFDKPVNITFKIIKESKRKLDKSNVYAVAAKYFYDALVELGVLVDDNDNFIKQETILETAYEKGIGKIIINIEEVKE